MSLVVHFEIHASEPQRGGPVAGASLVVAVDDVDGLFARGLELGGSEALAPDDMPGVGRLAYLVDPDGNVFGLVSPVASDGSVEMGAGAEGARAEALDPMNVTPEP